MSTIKEIEDIRQNSNGLAKLATLLGYKDFMRRLSIDHKTCVGDMLEFFDDNPGACEAVINWVVDNAKLFDIEDEDDLSDDEPDRASKPEPAE